MFLSARVFEPRDLLFKTFNRGYPMAQHVSMYISAFLVMKMGKSSVVHFYASSVEGENNAIVGDDVCSDFGSSTDRKLAKWG